MVNLIIFIILILSVCYFLFFNKRSNSTIKTVTENEYKSIMQEKASIVSRALFEITSAYIAKPDVEENTFYYALNSASTQITAVYYELISIKPPTKYAKFHEYYARGVKCHKDAIVLLIEGNQENNQTKVGAANDLMNKGNKYMKKANVISGILSEAKMAKEHDLLDLSFDLGQAYFYQLQEDKIREELSKTMTKVGSKMTENEYKSMMENNFYIVHSSLSKTTDIIDKFRKALGPVVPDQKMDLDLNALDLELRAVLKQIEVVYNEMMGIKPPRRYAEFHENYLTGLKYHKDGISFLIDEKNALGLIGVLDSMARGNYYFAKADENARSAGLF